MPQVSFYQEIVNRNIPHKNHCSDLYVPVTEETTKLIKEHGIKCVSTFNNQVEGGQWYDCSFQYEPYMTQRLEETAFRK